MIPFTVDGPVETNAYLCSMRLINVKAFLEREQLVITNEMEATVVWMARLAAATLIQRESKQ